MAYSYSILGKKQLAKPKPLSVPAPKTPKDPAGKIPKTMDEFKGGTLHSGSANGPVVENPKQALAIALNQARRYS